MDRERTRRSVLAAVLTGGVLGAVGTPVSSYLDRFAPFSGAVWDTVGDELPNEVTSPYGPATLRYDENGVPEIDADNPRSLAFATGYVQGADRLFQMELQRRQMRGELSAVVGEATVPSDRFHAKMDFLGAAEASWAALEGSETASLLSAFAAGVNRHIEGDRPLPIEFDLLEMEPSPWSPVDSLLAEKQIGWTLTGRFRTLRRETVRDALGDDVVETLYPQRLEHDAAVLKDGRGDQPRQSTGQSATGQQSTSDRATAIEPDLLDWLSSFESPDGVGSNSWVVAGQHTASGAPIVANDPHLRLMAPPVWYELSLTGPEIDTRGVTFPGVPFVVIGESSGGAWGFTNTGADVIDFYEYETRDGEYRHGDKWREFETEERTIAVADSEDRTVTVRKTVHGPVMDAESDGDDLAGAVGVAWTGFGATRTVEAVAELNRSDGLEDALAAVRKFDLPTQNFVYADRDGNTHYRVVGKVPIRRTDGAQVRGDRVFDGSAKAGEWAGYTPYGETDWEGEGFIPFEEMPHADQPEFLGTANQRILETPDAYEYYFEGPGAAPFRGGRLWDRLEERVAGSDPVDPAFMQSVQLDTYDERAAMFVPELLDAREVIADADLDQLLTHLETWDYQMVEGSRGALVFARFMDHYADVVFGGRLGDALGERRDVTEYYGDDWALIGLAPDSEWFPDGRTAAIEAALQRTATELDEEGWQTYGDYNTTTIDHPFDREWLNYPRYATDGSVATLNNYRKEDSVGSSWRMVCPMDKTAATSSAAFPGGNDGSVFSAHYDDQLAKWAAGEYKPIPLSHEGALTVRFRGADE